MGFWSSLCSAVGTGIKAVASGISSALSTVSANVGAAVKALVPALSKWAGNIGVAIQVISLCVEVAAKICELLRKNETVADIGERSLQAGEEGITLESCQNDYKAYLKRLREFELDPQKAAARPEIEKMAAGSLVLEKGLEELYPAMSTRDLWLALARAGNFFTPERLETYARLAKEQNFPFGETFAKFFMPPPDGHLGKKIYDFVNAAEKAFNPGATPNQIQREFREVREKCAAPEPEK